MPQQTGTPEESSPRPSSCFQHSPLSLAFGQHPPGFQLGQALWTMTNKSIRIFLLTYLLKSVGRARAEQREAKRIVV